MSVISPATAVPHSLSGSRSWCDTYMKEINFSFTWNIHKFSIHPEKTGEALTSSTFSTDTDDSLLWCLQLYPKGDTTETKDYLSVFLCLLSVNKTVKANYILSILNAEQEKRHQNESGLRSYSTDECDMWGHKKFVKYDFLFDTKNGLLCNDKLTLQCEITVYTEQVSTSGLINSSSIKVPECSLAEDFENLFECMHFSDVILSVKGHELRAHKNILSARSPVFAAMFRHEMEETKQNRVEIVDVDYEVLKEIVHFLYTGKLNGLEEMMADLLAAANKFALNRLKVMCEEALRPTLTIENVADVLVLADMHVADQLKAHAIDFIVAHAADVRGTVGWKSMVKWHCHLVDEVCNGLITKNLKQESQS